MKNPHCFWNKEIRQDKQDERNPAPDEENLCTEIGIARTGIGEVGRNEGTEKRAGLEVLTSQLLQEAWLIMKQKLTRHNLMRVPLTLLWREPGVERFRCRPRLEGRTMRHLWIAINTVTFKCDGFFRFRQDEVTY